MPTDERIRPRADLDDSLRVRLTRLLAFRPREVAALAALALLVLAGGAIAFVHARPGAATPPQLVTPVAAPAPSASASPQAILVHVAGAVRHPGVYEFALGARVIDAVRAAGGPAPGADMNGINLARPIADGERVYVPKRGEAPPPEPGGGAAPSGGGGGKVNLNTATAAELEALPGIGPVLAQRIVDYRTQHGPFRTVRDLLKVEGIGEKKFASIEPHVTV